MKIIEIIVESRTTNQNSLGKPIAHSEEALTNFWSWFNGSKVVDSQGRPLVVYHKTNADIDEFKMDKIGKSDFGFAGRGFYFLSFPLAGYTYGNTTMPIYLSLKNPYILSDSNWQQPYSPYNWIRTRAAEHTGNGSYDMTAASVAASVAWTKMAKDDGFDGFWDRTGKDDGEIVAFSPTQIKSTIANNGNYGQDEPRITYEDAVRELLR